VNSAQPANWDSEERTSRHGRLDERDFKTENAEMLHNGIWIIELITDANKTRWGGRAVGIKRRNMYYQSKKKNIQTSPE
jgi:hypothetical protein